MRIMSDDEFRAGEFDLEWYLPRDAFELLLACRPYASGSLHGPAVAAWVRVHHGDVREQLGENLTRNIERWEDGTPASLRVVDRVLTALGGHLTELPPDFWIDAPQRKPRRKGAAARRAAPEPPQEVAA
jgi:hypothetical protein